MEDYKKKYKEALEIGKAIIKRTNGTFHRKDLEDMFPELAESEDERIRKELLHFFGEYALDFEWHGIKAGKITAWLEKQGEQKPVEANNDSTIDARLNDYCCKVYNSLQEGNGGVLSFARLQRLAMDIQKWCKEQQQLEWSEEDDRMVGNIRRIIEKYAFSQSAVDVNGDLCEKEFIDADNWLKYLKDRYTWKPSDEQIECLSSHIAHREKNESSYSLNVLRDLLGQLKKLREEDV